MSVLGNTVISDNLKTNLQALKAIGSPLRERLVLPASERHIQVNQRSRVQYVHQGMAYALANEKMPNLVGEDSCFIFGIGLGENLSYALGLSSVKQVIAWDRDPFLMCLALSRYDLSQDILSGRLQLSLASDLLTSLQCKHKGIVLYHPFLARIYSQERYLLEHGVGNRCVAVGTGGLFVDDLVSALHELGYDTFPVEFSKWSEAEIAYTLDHIDAEFVATINYTVGLAEFCNQVDRPLVVWEIDPCTDRLAACSTSNTNSHIFTYHQGNLRAYQAAGFPHVEYLPLAANPKKRRPVPGAKRSKYAAPVSFVGSSMVQQANHHKQRFLSLYTELNGGDQSAHDEGMEKLKALLDEHRCNFSENLLPQLVPKYFPDLQQRLTAISSHTRPLMLIGELVAAEKRLNYVAALGHLGIHVWGDNSWRMTEASGAIYEGQAGHHKELTYIYSGSHINIDINRIYQPNIVTMRVFDVLACGGFLIAEWSEDLEQLFELGIELECHRNLEELKDKVSYYQRNTSAANAIAKRGLSAVRERHTIRQRLQYMLSSINPSQNQSVPAQSVQNPMTEWVKMETRPRPILWG